jgi:hypothetical protein
MPKWQTSISKVDTHILDYLNYLATHINYTSPLYAMKNVVAAYIMRRTL